MVDSDASQDTSTSMRRRLLIVLRVGVAACAVVAVLAANPFSPRVVADGAELPAGTLTKLATTPLLFSVSDRLPSPHAGQPVLFAEDGTVLPWAGPPQRAGNSWLLQPQFLEPGGYVLRYGLRTVAFSVGPSPSSVLDPGPDRSLLWPVPLFVLAVLLPWRRRDRGATLVLSFVAFLATIGLGTAGVHALDRLDSWSTPTPPAYEECFDQRQSPTAMSDNQCAASAFAELVRADGPDALARLWSSLPMARSIKQLSYVCEPAVHAGRVAGRVASARELLDQDFFACGYGWVHGLAQSGARTASNPSAAGEQAEALCEQLVATESLPAEMLRNQCLRGAGMAVLYRSGGDLGAVVSFCSRFEVGLDFGTCVEGATGTLLYRDREREEALLGGRWFNAISSCRTLSVRAFGPCERMAIAERDRLGLLEEPQTYIESCRSMEVELAGACAVPLGELLFYKTRHGLGFEEAVGICESVESARFCLGRFLVTYGNRNDAEDVKQLCDQRSEADDVVASACRQALAVVENLYRSAHGSLDGLYAP